MSRITKVSPNGHEVAFGHDAWFGWFVQVFNGEEQPIIDYDEQISALTKERIKEIGAEYGVQISDDDLDKALQITSRQRYLLNNPHVENG